MGINIDKFNKWHKECGLEIELTTEQWTVNTIPESSLKIKGHRKDLIKCLAILMNNWDKKNKAKKVQNVKEDK